MILVIVWFVARPINQMNDDIEIIANGDCAHKIRQIKGPEFDRLESSITKMISTLHQEIERNKEQAKQLDQELIQRKCTEDSLLNTTKQLNLLSGITRHDILNQIMVANGVLELMSRNRENNEKDEEMDEELYASLCTSIKNIEKQILFTKLYEQMGHKG